MTRNQRSYPICLKRINAAVLVIVFLYVCISTPSFTPYYSRDLQKNAQISTFLQLTKSPDSNHLDEISKTLQCVPTSNLKIIIKHDDTWILQSYTRDGTKKEKGGDEYFVTYKDSNNNLSSPSAIAHIKDNEDGSYALHFVKSRNPQVMILKLAGKGTVTLNLIYTCGIGLLEPPLKNNWTLDMKNGAANAEFQALDHPMPIMNKPYWPKRYGHELSQYERIFAIGDSLMAGIFKNRRPNIKCLGHVGASLNSQTIPIFLQKKLLASHRKTAKETKMAVILGSCVWDILAAHTSSFDKPGRSFVMSEHLESTKSLIRTIQTKFPEFDIYWKGCTSVHLQSLNSSCFQDEKCAPRVLYMSSRRAKKLDVAQKAIMKELNIPVLDMFDMSFEMTDYFVDGDGRHFEPKWYRYMIDYFFPESKKK